MSDDKSIINKERALTLLAALTPSDIEMQRLRNKPDKSWIEERWLSFHDEKEAAFQAGGREACDAKRQELMNTFADEICLCLGFHPPHTYGDDIGDWPGTLDGDFGDTLLQRLIGLAGGARTFLLLDMIAEENPHDRDLLDPVIRELRRRHDPDGDFDQYFSGEDR